MNVDKIFIKKLGRSLPSFFNIKLTSNAYLDALNSA